METPAPGLQSFLLATQNVHENAILALTSDRRGICTRTRRVARWISHFRIAQNRELSRRFVDALRKECGDEPARGVTASGDLARILQRGKPLSARQARLAHERVKALKDRIHEQNTRVANALTEDGEGGPGNSLRTAIAEAAQALFPQHHTASRFVNCSLVATAVRQAIVADAGGEGARQVTAAQAKEIVATIARRAVEATFQAAQDAALDALNPRKPNSIAHEVLVEKFAQHAHQLNLEAHRLSPDAIDVCFKRFETAFGTAQILADQFDDEGALRQLADEKLTCFMEERVAACARVDELDFLSGQERAALRAQVIRDDIPGSIVSTLGHAYHQVRDDLDALTKPLPPRDLRHRVSRLRSAIADALREARADITVENQDRVYRAAWRLLLAPGGAAQSEAILRQLEQDESPLRGVGEALIWYREDFPGTDEWDRTFKNVGDELNDEPIYEKDESRQAAAEYAVVLRTLQHVVAENTGISLGPAQKLEANANPTDETVATVRNLGIPFPAPERVGRYNDNVPLSDGAWDVIKASLNRHVERAGRARHSSGLVKETMAFLRAGDRVRAEQRERVGAGFVLDGLPVLGNAEVVAARLQEFCTDTDGQLNEEMLAGISLMLNRAPFDCVYDGCMNPDRPDLAIVNGYSRGVFLGHTYSLWKDAADGVRLQVREQVKPVYFHAVDQHSVLPDAAHELDEGAHPPNPILLSDDSDFQSVIEVRFDPQTYRPEIQDVRIRYALVQGMPSKRWFIKHPELESQTPARQSPTPGTNHPAR